MSRAFTNNRQVFQCDGCSRQTQWFTANLDDGIDAIERPCLDLLANLLDLAAGTVPVTTVRNDEESGRRRSLDPVEIAAIGADRGSAGLPVGVQVIALDRRPGTAEEVVITTMRAIATAGLGSVTSQVAG